MADTTKTDDAASLEDMVRNVSLAEVAPPNPDASKGAGAAEEPESNLVTSNYDVIIKLADLQGDPNSPLYSVKSFEELGL